MKPKKKSYEPQSDIFKPRLEDIVNPAHPLVRLTAVIDWDRLDAELGQHFATVGAAALPTRLMAGQMYLQHLHNLSSNQPSEMAATAGRGKLRMAADRDDQRRP